jgi:hypothetical protein
VGIKSKSIAPILVSGLLAGCSSPTPHPSRFEREFQQYLSLPPHKVFVIAGDPEDRFVYGYGYKARSDDEAKDTGMEQCNIRKQSLSTRSECVVYAIGNEVVWQGFPEGAPKRTTTDHP